ncbi:FecR family protein [Winogradskyella vidalii]|uniref:FecR family protein n=1 Tax=Winogradskyella vidalii TaxID=2615024 RepID=UPI0015CB7655|nr:FecR family protein [Winogradskyella vidalii]
MKKKEFIKLVDKYADGNSTPKETELVESFFDEQQVENDITNIIEHRQTAIFDTIQKQLPKEKQTSSFSSSIYLKVAAVAAVVVICFLSFQFISQPTTISHIAAKGEKKEVILHDGSVVTLNANSSISYSSDFTTNRNVKLKGQAFFKVKRDTLYPFTVNTDQIGVEVLGTSFDVNTNSYSVPTVSVVSGVVKVSDNQNSANNVIIRKNEQVVFNDNKLVSTKTDDDIDVAWTKNTIHLQNSTLRETRNILENWYNIKIDFEDKELEELTISGKYKNEKIENIIKSIALLKGLEIDTLTTKHILIRKNKN